MNTYFHIDSVESFADEKITIKLENLPDVEEITIQAESEDLYCINALPNVSVGSLWQSSVTYIVEGSCVFCLDTAVAIRGDYTGVHPMGIFYYMKPVDIRTTKKSNDLANIPVHSHYHITLRAYSGKKLLCETTIIRKYMDSDIVCEDIKLNQLLARFFYSEKKLNVPTIIVLSGSDGRIEKAQNIAQMLTRYGINALAVCYFGLNGVSETLTSISLELIEEAIAFIKLKTGNDKIGIYGRSKGGELALLAASELESLSCVVANTPSNYIFEGINNKRRMSKQPSWTYKDKHYSYIPFKIRPFIPYLIQKTLFRNNNLQKPYTYLLKKYGNEQNRIKVENVKGPFLLLSAHNDEIWPSSMFCEDILSHLDGDFHYEYQHQNYNHVGHMLTIAYQPNPRYRKNDSHCMLEESVDAWMKTVQFFVKWIAE